MSFKVGDEVIVYKNLHDAFDDELGKVFIINVVNNYTDEDSGLVWHGVGKKYQLPECIIRKLTKLEKALK